MQDAALISLSDGVSFQPLGNGEGGVVLIIESGQLYTCNDTTSAFLTALDGQRKFADVVQILLDEFDVTEDALRSDLSSLAADLKREGIIRVQ